MPLVIQTSASRGLLGGYEHITRLARRRQQISRLSAVEMMMVEFHFFIQTARHGVRALPIGTTQTTYGLPQKEQTAPSWTGEPQLGHFRSSTSPQRAQNLPPTGSDSLRSGMMIAFPAAWTLRWLGQSGLGQKPEAGESVEVGTRSVE